MMADVNHVSGLEVNVAPTRAVMGARAAAFVAGSLRDRLARQDQVRMIFAAAPSQYEMLVRLREEHGIDWRRVTAFHMDEYVGLPSNSPAAFGAWLTTHLFRHLPFDSVHLIDRFDDPAVAADSYSRQLAEEPIDIVCLGIGVNGHLAFNDPPANLEDTQDVRVVYLDDTCRQQQVDDDCFATVADVPKRAITLTVPRLLRADKLVCVVPGTAKADAVARALHGPVSSDCPASALRRHPDCALFIDVDAASGFDLR